MGGWQSGAQTLSRCLIYNNPLSKPRQSIWKGKVTTGRGRGWRPAATPCPPKHAGVCAYMLEPALRIRAGRSMFMSWHVSVAGVPLYRRRVWWPLGTSEPMDRLEQVRVCLSWRESLSLEHLMGASLLKSMKSMSCRSPGQDSGGMIISTASRRSWSHPLSPISCPFCHLLLHTLNLPSPFSTGGSGGLSFNS